MRLAWLPVLVLVVGCVAQPSPEAPRGNETPVAAPEEESAPPPVSVPIGERMPAGMERFVLLANHTLGVMRPEDPELALANVPETLTPTAFWESFAQPLTLTPWASDEFRVPFETTGELDVTIRFMSDVPAVAAQPKAAGFPGAGGWIGTTERFAFFTLAADAPDSLEAGKVYTVHLKGTPPAGGFFVRAGERLAVYTFLSYQTADGTPVEYVIGGPEPAGIALAHAHFNVTAPRAIVILDEVGEIGPNPGPAGDLHREPVDLPLKVPADAVYVVLEVDGTPKAGTRIDIDGSFRTPSGEPIAGGSGPNAREVAVLGPGNLQASGRDLVARVTCASCPAGGTYTLKVTAYAP